VRVKEVMVLGYAKEGCLEPGWIEKTSGRCYWCGNCEEDRVGDKRVVLFPFRMMWEKVERINLACRKCYREFSGLAEAGKNKSSKKKGRTR
jgi:hypothetical protein